MVARIDSVTALTSRRPAPVQVAPPVVPQAPQVARQPSAPRAERAEVRPVIAPASMAALIQVQELFADNSQAAEKVSAALLALIERLGHKRPKPPATPPVVAPLPPAPTPAPVVVDSPAPARMLQMVREQLHTRPASRTPDLPFSKREAAAAAYRNPRPAVAPMAMLRAVAQGEAALMLIQAGQMNLYQRNAQPHGGVQSFGLFHSI